MPFLSRPSCELYYETHGSGPALVFDQGLSGSEFLNSDRQLAIVGDVYGPDVTLRPGGSGTAVVQGRVVARTLKWLAMKRAGLSECSGSFQKSPPSDR